VVEEDSARETTESNRLVNAVNQHSCPVLSCEIADRLFILLVRALQALSDPYCQSVFFTYFYFFTFKACKFVCGLSDVLIKLLMMMMMMMMMSVSVYRCVCVCC